MNFKEPSNPAATSEGDKSGAGGGRIRDRNRAAPREDGMKPRRVRDGHKL